METERTVSRDIPATIVPYGDQITIPEGTRVMITHRLGGNFTVTFEGGMAQINGHHADAIGEEAAADTGGGKDEDHEGPPEEDMLWDALRKVYDPEIPVNIFDLGLIYELDIHKDGSAKVVMTLTAPGCPVAGEMPGMVADALDQLPGIGEIEVTLTFDPPWTPDMMSEDARLALGF